MGQLSIRLAIMKDAPMLLSWRNDPETRENSAQQHIVTWEEHIGWLKKVLSDPNRTLVVVEENGQPVGTVRFDTDESGDTEFSITVAPGMRGQGVGRKIYAYAPRWFGKKVWGKIKHTTIAALKATQYAGWKVDEEKTDNEFVYVYFDPDCCS